MFGIGSFLGFFTRTTLLVAVVSVGLFGGDWVVVAGGGFKSGSLSQKQVKDIFLKKKTPF